MPDSLRLQILKNLTTALEEIKPGNGYTHDLTDAVYRGRTKFGDNDKLPMLCILEPPIPLDQIPSPSGADTQKGPWELMIQGFVEDDKKNPLDPAYELMAEVKKRLAVELKKTRPPTILGKPMITSMKIGSGTVRPPDEVSAKAYFWLNLTLEVVEDMSDPFPAP